MTAHPIQEIEMDTEGVVRFRQNKIVRFLLDAGPFDLNQLALMNFSKDDHAQLAQLIGYSVSGYGDLSYADPETVEYADMVAGEMMAVKLAAEKRRCIYEWSTVNDPPCHPSDIDWHPCPLCSKATEDNTPASEVK